MSDDDSGVPPEEQARWERLARYIAGECSADEEDVMRRQLLEDPVQGALFRALADRPRPIAPATGVDVEEALRRVRARVASDNHLPIAKPTAAWRVPALAAAAVVVVAVGALLSRSRSGDRAGPRVAAARIFTAPIGARDSVRLPDGSRILLGPGSVLTVAAAYGSPDRDVSVSGDALLEVRHDPAHPFTVHTATALIRDVGTTFSVHDGANGVVRVVVTAGAVLLRASSHPDTGVVLRGGFAGTLSEGGVAVARSGGASADDLAWTNGQLVFREAPLDEVAAELRRWYGIELRVDDPALASRHLTATFSGDPAKQVVQVIALAVGAQVAWQGDTVVMRR